VNKNVGTHGRSAFNVARTCPPIACDAAIVSVGSTSRCSILLVL